MLLKILSSAVGMEEEHHGRKIKEELREGWREEKRGERQRERERGKEERQRWEMEREMDGGKGGEGVSSLSLWSSSY